MSSYVIKSTRIKTSPRSYYIELYQNKFSRAYCVASYEGCFQIFRNSYPTIEKATRAFNRQVKKYKAFEDKPHTRENYPDAVDWLETLTAYEWQPELVPITYDDAQIMLDKWQEEQIDDIPREFLTVYGYKLLANLWNAYIV